MYSHFTLDLLHNFQLSNLKHFNEVVVTYLRIEKIIYGEAGRETAFRSYNDRKKGVLRGCSALLICIEEYCNITRVSVKLSK